MRAIIFNYTSIFLMIAFISCSKNNEKNPILEKAFQVHEASMSVAKEVQEMLKELPQEDSIVMRLNQRFNNWQEVVVEVPGFEHTHEHNHEHGHEHHHHHEQELNLTPQQIFDIQVELQDSIAALKKEVMLFKEQ